MRLSPVKLRSRWPLAICVLVSFVVGYGVSLVSRTPTSVAETKIQVADFRVAIPEGETTVTVTSRDPEGRQLGQLKLQRRGDTVIGIPAIERRITPRERLTVEDAAFLRREIGAAVSPSDPPWQKANKLRAWLAQLRYRLGMPGLSTRKPREAYEQMKTGQAVLCGNLADIYVALCEAMGLTARVVGLTVAVQNGLFGVDTHAGAEVWIPEMGGWIYEDPTFNCYWQIDGKPASAMQLHDAVMARRTVEFAPHNKQTEQRLRDYYLDVRLYFRQISYEYKPGGTVLYFADPRLEPLNLRDQNWVHTDSREDIRRLDTDEVLVVERRFRDRAGCICAVVW
jgi:hypothetical protein